MKLFIFAVVVALFSLPSLSKSVEDLYDAKVLVLDQSLENRQAGARLGLLEVLQKISGFPVPADQVVINKALNIADQYLYQFSYASLEDDESQNKLPGALWLRMRFEERSIQRLIKRGKLPRWGKNRPSILVWMAIDDGVERKIVNEGMDNPVYKSLRDGARRRGLPLIYPINDLEDSMALPIEQLWGMFDEPIVSASARYGAESVLAARVYKTIEGKWKGQWSFYFRSVEQSFAYETETLDEQVLLGLSESAQVLANSFALKPSNLGNNSISIVVSGVSSLSDYAKLTQYLERLAITKRVAINELSKDELSIGLVLNGSVKQLKQTLGLDRKLVPKSTANGRKDSSEGLETERFAWNR